MKFREITRLPRKLLRACVMEGIGTTRMVDIYTRYGSGKLNLTPVHRRPTREELLVAGEQLKDIPRSLVFLVAFLIPLPGVVGGYILISMMVERWLGHKIKLLPTRFRQLLVPEN